MVAAGRQVPNFRFQFYKVRLELISRTKVYNINRFQFYKVRLEQDAGLNPNMIYNKFQFYKVRLELFLSHVPEQILNISIL